MGFKASQYEPGLWIHQTIKGLYLTTYVDDFKSYSKNVDHAKWAIDALAQKFEIKNVSAVSKYLGVNIDRQDESTTTLNQQDYATDLIASFGLYDAHPVRTPFDTGMKIDGQPDNSMDRREYQRGVGSLNWLAVKTRPDMGYATGVLAQFNSNPTKKAWAALKHLLRYLKGTIDYGLTYHRSDDSSPMPVCYTDADWAGNITPGRRSTSGYVIMAAGGPVMWRSQKQSCTALSTNEAEYIAASDASRDALWMRNIVRDLGLIDESQGFPPITIHIDNAGAQAMADDTLTTKRSKHVDVRYHFIREKAHDGVIEL